MLHVSCVKIPVYHIDQPCRGLMYGSTDGPKRIIIVSQHKALKCCAFLEKPRNSIIFCEALDAITSNVHHSGKRGNLKHVIHDKAHKCCCIGSHKWCATRGVDTMHTALRKTDQKYLKNAIV